MNKITSVCVYCASSTKIDSAYFEAARELGTLLGATSYPTDKWCWWYRTDEYYF